MQTLLEKFPRLIHSVSTIRGVYAIAKSGGEKLPETGESDIDVFVFCETVPERDAREAAVHRLGDMVTSGNFSEGPGKHWGTCDFVNMEHDEICLMYFPIDGMDQEILAVLSGQRLDKEDNYFYPTGRCASFLTMHALYDPHGYIASAKRRIADYPAALSEGLLRYHLSRLTDTEDIQRAVSRKDPLFYHFALDIALDHFLQALFALNRCYFPSRKRSIEHIRTFAQKPVDCEARLVGMIALGGNAESIAESYEILRGLTWELSELAQSK